MVNFKIDLTDLIASLKFHAKFLQDGVIYVALTKNAWRIASIQSIHSDLWCLEKVTISQDLPENLFDSNNSIESSPLQLVFDKSTIDSFLAFISILKKNKNLFTIDETKNSYIFSNNENTYELVKDDINFPGFSDDLTEFATIKSADWSAIKFLADKIDPATYLKAVSGVYVDTNLYIYATDMSNVFIGKLQNTYEKAFFVPSGVISKGLSPSKDVIILAGSKTVVFVIDNVKFIINHPIEGNQVTNNDVFPIGEARALREGFPADWRPICTIGKEGIQTICNSFSQYIAQQKTEEIVKYNFAMVINDNNISVNVIDKNYKSNVQIATIAISNEEKPKQISMSKKFLNAINLFPIILKGENTECNMMYDNTNDIVAIKTINGIHPISDVLMFTNHVKIQR